MCHERCPAPICGGQGITESEVTIQSQGQAIPVFVAQPDHEESAPGVVVIHDVWGANDFYHDVTRRLAGAGFTAILPDFFVREGPPAEQTREAVMERRGRMDQTTAVHDVGAAIRWLQQQPATGGRVGTVGFCLGGTLVMLSAGEDPLPDAGVAFYGFPFFTPDPKRPTCPLNHVAQIGAPLPLLWGDQDAGVGVENMHSYDKALSDADKRHETVIYPGAPHGFLTFDAEDPQFAAATDAWQRTVAFLTAELA